MLNPEGRKLSYKCQTIVSANSRGIRSLLRFKIHRKVFLEKQFLLKKNFYGADKDALLTLGEVGDE